MTALNLLTQVRLGGDKPIIPAGSFGLFAILAPTPEEPGGAIRAVQFGPEFRLDTSKNPAQLSLVAGGTPIAQQVAIREVSVSYQPIAELAGLDLPEPIKAFLTVTRNGLVYTVGIDYSAEATRVMFFPGSRPQKGDLVVVRGLTW